MNDEEDSRRWRRSRRSGAGDAVVRREGYQGGGGVGKGKLRRISTQADKADRAAVSGEIHVPLFH